MAFLTRRAALICAATSPLWPLSRIAAAAPDDTAAGSTQNVLAGVMAGTPVPGMAAMVIRDFRAQSEQVAGIRRIGGTDPIRRGDRWQTGSDGKAMTATMIARLVERRILSWDTPLERLLPDLAARMRADYRDVTLPDLLSHRSGLPENFSDIDFYAKFFSDPAPLPDQRWRYITAALGEAPVMPKRTKHSYSNTGFVIAAVAAERATGRDFETLMAQTVFRSLQMRSVSYETLGGQDEPIGHVDKRVADRLLDPNPRMLAPSDGTRLSLTDWSRFCIDQMRGEHGHGRLLRAETYRFLHTRQGETPFALGWIAQKTFYGLRGPVIYHSGSNGNWMAEAVLFPQRGNGALVVANAAYGMDGNKAADAALRLLALTLSEPAVP